MEGGAISGIFGAGVLSAFNSAKIHSRVHSIYTVSAGAHLGAYFLSEKPIVASGIYTKELMYKRNKFFKLGIFGLWKSFWKLLFKRENLHLLDLDVLRAIEKTKRKLDFHKIKKSKIKFFVAVFDHENMMTKYIDGKKDTIEVINLSSYLAPYIFLETKTKHVYDGKTVPNAVFLDIMEEHKDKRIIWIMNERRTNKHQIKDIPFRVIDMYAKSMYFGFRYLVYHLIHFFDESSIETIHTYSNVTLIYPDQDVRKITRDKKRILGLFKNGISRGKKILKKFKIK
ncbi:MAG: patatin-like phospholipase family protein [archaeon]